MARRLLGNAKNLAVSVVIAAAAMLVATAQCLPQFAQVRPYVLEISAGRAQVTKCFSKCGWRAAKPVGIKWGANLCKADERKDLLEWIDQHRPRLVIVSYPSLVLGDKPSILDYSTKEETSEAKTTGQCVA